MNLRWFQYALLFLVSLQLCRAEECDCDGFFCVSDTEFQLCVNGETVGDRIPCITGAVCGNDTETQCSPQLLCQEKNACTAEGIFPDKNSKFRYFTCALNLITSEWDMREYVCPEGTYFLEGIGSCGAEEIISDTKFSCPDQGYFPDPENCQKYFQCDEGSNAFIRYCPETTYFDVDTGTCLTDLPERCLELQAPTVEPLCGGDSENSGVSTVQPSTSQTDNDETSTVYSTQDPSTVEPSTLQTNNDEMSTVYSTEAPSTVEPSTLQTNNDEITTVYSTEDPSTIQSSTSQTDNDEASTVYSTQNPSTVEPSTLQTNNDEMSTVYSTQDPSTVEPSTLQTNNDEMSTVYRTEEPDTTSGTTDDYTTDKWGDIVTSTPKRDTSEVSTTTSGPIYDGGKQNGFVCPGEGFYPDQEDCNRYFVCNSMGIAIQILCPENTFYDEELQGCTSDMPDRCRPPPPDFNFLCATQGFFPDPENCQRYYVCKSSGIATLVSCPEYHYFDEENMLCSLNKPERCMSSDKPSNDYTSSTTPSTTVVPTETKGTTTVTPNIEEQKTTTRGPQAHEFQCPGGGYYPHPQDCKQYFICTRFDNLYILELVTCPENKNFDIETTTCTDEIPERCRGYTTTPIYPQESTTPAKETGFICPGEGNYPDPKDCQSYYVCEGSRYGKRVTCPNKTYFNDRSTYCSDENPYCSTEIPERCRVPQEPPQNDTPTLRPPIGQFICPGEGNYPDPYDCQSYYVCEGSRFGKRVTCPNKTYFNDRSTYCSDENPYCSTEIPERCRVPQEPPQNDTPTLRPPIGQFICPGEGNYPDPYDCQSYYVCEGSRFGKRVTCPNKTYFNDRSTYCSDENPYCSTEVPERCRVPQEPPQNDTPTLRPPVQEFICPGEGNYPDPNDCQSYYVCEGSRYGKRVTCPNKTYFNDRSTYCSDENPYCSTEVPERCRVPQEPPQNNTPTLRPPIGQFICPGEGNYPDPYDCQSYYVCEGSRFGKRVTCPNKTYFNDRSTYCSDENPYCSTEIPERCRVPQEPPQNDTPTLRPPIGQFICPGEGNYPDPNDCQSYYVCEGSRFGKRVTCPNKTYFNDRSTYCSDENPYCSTEVPERCRVPQEPPQNDTPTLRPPVQEFICPGEGNYPDPNDCQSYYVCEGSRYGKRVTCPNKTYFNDRSTYCSDENPYCSTEVPERCRVPQEPPQNDPPTFRPPVKEFTCPGEGYYSDPDDCHSYYACTAGISIRITCPENTFFDDTDEMCSFDLPERCRGYTTTPRYPQESTTPAKETGFICPGEGNYPDPKDCQSYYVCEGSRYGKRVTCPNKTYFNDRSTYCSDENPYCSTEVPERCRITEEPPQNDPPTFRPPVKEFTCPGEGYYSDPDDCHSYYACTAGISIRITCPENTFFDDTDEMCSFDLPERCRGYTTTPRYPQESTTPAKETGFICPGEGNYPDPKDCQSYYVCEGSRFGKRVTCPNKTYFNDRSTYCSDENPYCSTEVPERCRVPQEPPQNDTPTLRPPVQEFFCPGEGYYPDPRDCQKYYVCMRNNFSMSVSCPENTFYDADSTYCTSEMPERCVPTTPGDHVSTTPAPKEEEFKCPEKGYFPDPNNCQRYFFCFEFGLSMSFTCPVNTYFDEEYAFCSSRMPARCKEESTGPPQENEDGTFVCEDAGMFPDEKDCQKYWVCFGKNLGYSVECPKGTYYHEDSFFCLKQVPERCKQLDGFRCPGEGFFADPFDCNLYHVCYPWGIDLTARCPENTYYNDETNSCDVDVPERCKNSGNSLCPTPGSYPDPEDCSSYFVCDSQGRRTSVICPENEYFDEKLGKCSSEIPERCKKVVTTTETPTSSSEEFICRKRGSFPIEDDCYRYYYCSKAGSEAVISSCPKNQFFNISKGRCRKIKRGDECLRQMEDSNKDC